VRVQAQDWVPPGRRAARYLTRRRWRRTCRGTLWANSRMRWRRRRRRRWPARVDDLLRTHARRAPWPGLCRHPHLERI